MINRVTAYEISIQMRMLQSEELKERIIDEWSKYSENEQNEAIVVKNTIRTFRRFTEWKWDIFNAQVFEEIFNQVWYTRNSLEHTNFVSTNSHLTTILDFLSKGYDTIESNNEEEIILPEINYELIVEKKASIQFALCRNDLGESLKQLLRWVYEYYTQYWRILEIYGDLYNDVNLFIDTFIRGNSLLFNKNVDEIQSDTTSEIIYLENGLEYNPIIKSFKYMQYPEYCIIWGDTYKQREKFMEVLCRNHRQDMISYQELMETIWKDDNHGVQTVYKNIKDGLEKHFHITKNISNFCKNIPRVWYRLKRR